MSVLILDNYDSFAHNLARYFRLLGQATEVVRSDTLTVEQVVAKRPAAIVISPGPRAPESAGVSLAVIERCSGMIPLLGVCLGHQAIGQAFGGRIDRAPPVHGRASEIEHDGSGLFRDLPSPLSVARYHSLVVAADSLPAALRVTATTAEGLVMAVEHREHPTYGVQFHPESILSDAGLRLLQNFLQLAGVASAEATTSLETAL